MPIRDHAPPGAPCWADLFTSDVEGSRAFYGEVFGWEAQEPSPEFGGYFMFHRHGVPVGGGMGDMPDVPATNSWKIYLSTNDITKTIELAEGKGAQVVVPAMPVADLGQQAVLIDPTGATVGAWQPGTFPGFTVLGEHGSPSWFELHSRDHDRALAFYRSVFGFDTQPIPGPHDIRYDIVRDPSGDGELAGMMDASSILAEGVPSAWSVYWEVDDLDATAAKVTSLGGAVVMAPEDTPYGRLATVRDPAGAEFKLRTAPR